MINAIKEFYYATKEKSLITPIALAVFAWVIFIYVWHRDLSIYLILVPMAAIYGTQLAQFLDSKKDESAYRDLTYNTVIFVCMYLLLNGLL